MLELITTYYLAFLAFTKSNPVIAGVVSLWGLAVLTFFLKKVPLSIYNGIKNQLTTNLVINSHDIIYYDCLDWLSKNKMHNWVRNFSFTNKGKYGWGVPIISIGYGSIIFMFNKRLFWMSRYKVDANQTSETKETITLTILGRSHSYFKQLFEFIQKDSQDNSYLDIYEFHDKSWVRSNHQFKRNIDTVIIEKDIKNKILHHIDEFIKNKDWYINNGIPYRTGLLLSGPPGTGKSSLIKAICSKYDKPLYILELSHLSDNSLAASLAQIPKGSIVAIEDIDTKNLTKRPKSEHQLDNMSNLDFSMLTLGGVLNAIDGLSSSEDRIIIATANNPELLDDALLREGRFDLKTQLGYMTNETMKQYLERFYSTKVEGWSVKPNIAPCLVQKLVFENRTNINNVLNVIANKTNV